MTKKDRIYMRIAIVLLMVIVFCFGLLAGYSFPVEEPAPRHYCCCGGEGA